MNILYQKSKLLGRPFRNDDDAEGYGWWTPLLEPTFDWGAVDFGIEPGSYSDPEARAEIDAIIEAGNEVTPAKFDFLKSLPTGIWNAVKKSFQDKDGKYDFAKLGAAGGALMSLTGLGKAQPGGYQGVVPKQVATRQQITYDDPNRRPGAGGRDYFTDTIYSPEKDTAAIDAAKAASQAQATGILAGYKKADVAAPATTKFKTPWEKAADTGTKAAATGAGANAAAALPAIPNAMEIAQQTYPEKFMSNDGGGPVDGGMIGLATGGITPRMPSVRQPRYLRGITDGMEDKIKTSIDGKQKALLSHGEFVIPADVVSHLGNGNSDAGAKKLYQMMDRVRQARTGNKKQGKQINPDKFMPGGQVGYDKGGIVAFESGGVTDTTTSSGLAPYVGDYTTKALGDFEAASTMPYEGFKGPLTAGASDLQTSAFAGIKDLATTGYTPGTFTTGTFDTAAANQYMNPYLNASLNPQLKELRRQAQITNLGSLAKAGRAGIMSGDSRNLMEAENMRNLLSKQSDVLGTGYATAYDKAMDQFNKEQGRSLEAQKADEESRKTSADYSRNVLNDMAKLGQTQRDIDAEGIAADIKEFENQRDYDAKSAQARIALLQKLPVGSSTTEANTNPVTDYLKNSGTIIALFKQMGLIK